MDKIHQLFELNIAITENIHSKLFIQIYYFITF